MASSAAQGLIGRDEELAAAHRLLLEERCAIVTLWGPGGIGKTSLARAAQRACAPSFAGGTYFAALAGARDLIDLLAIVADTLDLGAGSAAAAASEVTRIGRSLAARGRALVILDNVEQIVADAAAALITWTTMAPDVSFLVTSRELLAAPGERPCELLPLPIDAPAGSVPEAVRLLLDRARAVRPAFEADPLVLRAIVERLDGIPLAIELAAAQLALMSAEQLLARLDNRFDVLRRGHGNAERRQRTMHDAIDWSWSLLDEDERRILEGLSVFRGFDLDAVAAVLGPDAIGHVNALRHKSLVAESTVLGPHDLRFVLLQAIRDFAAEKLGARASEVERAHAAYYADVAEAAAGLEAEHDNVLVVAERFRDQPAAALRALVALENVLTSRGAANQLAALLARALDETSAEAAPRALRLRALEVHANALLSLGRLAEAYDVATSALGLPETDVERARLLIVLGLVRQAQGRQAEAMELETSALAHAVSGNARREQGLALANLGLVHHVLDAFAEARACYEQSLPLLVEVGDVRAQVRTRARIGFLLQDLGDPAGAMTQYAEAARLDTNHGLRLLEGTLTGYIGNVRRAEGQIEEAITVYDRAIARLRVLGDRRFEATFLMDRGIARTIADQYTQALNDLETAASMAAEIAASGLVALTLGYVIVGRAALGDATGARQASAEARAAASGNAAMLELLDVHEAHIDLGNAPPAAIAEARRTLTRFSDRLGQHRRLAADLLRRALDRAAPPEGALVLRGGRLRVPSGAWLELDKRPPWAGVVGLLVARRLADAGAVVPLKELVAVGWPGEKLVAGAGANRLRVLVSGLRAGGLAEVLRSGEGGYFLDPEVPVISD